MNWKIVIGVLLIFGGLKEITSIINDYNSGVLTFWSFGADLGCLILIVAGIYLIQKGREQKRRL